MARIPRRIKSVLMHEFYGRADARTMRYFHRWFERFSDQSKRRLQRLYARLFEAQPRGARRP